MRFSILLPASLICLSQALPQTRSTHCVPDLYTLSDYSLTTTSGSASVSFNFQSTFNDNTGIDDSVRSGASCQATGSPTVPNSNECNVPKRNLLFDLRAPVEQGRFRVTHTWLCDGKQWMSGNDVNIPQQCDKVGDVTTCKAGTQTFAPQNVRQIPTGP